MKIVKRFTALLLVAVMALSLAACNKTNPDSGKETTAKGSATEQGITGTTPFEEKQQLTILMPSWGTEGNNEMHKVWMERMNCELTFITCPMDSYEEKLSSILVSGEWPDIISFGNKYTAFEKWVEQDALLELEDLIAQYGQDYAKWITEDNKDWVPKIDGKVYSLVQFNTFPYYYTAMYREDWVKEANLETPETMEDWLNLWRVFKNTDLNGNGMLDEIPVDEYFKTFFQSAYGIKLSSKYFSQNADGTVVPLYMQEHYLEYLTAMRDAFAEGLIDKEYVARDSEVLRELSVTGYIGSTWSAGCDPMYYTNESREAGDPDAVWAPVTMPKGVYGTDPIIKGRTCIEKRVGISKTCKNPEAAMRMLNYLFTDEGYILTNYGVEGVTFDYNANGEPRLKADYLTWDSVRGWGMNPISLCFAWDGDMFIQMNLAGKTYEELTDIEKLGYHGYVDTAPYCYSELPTSIFGTGTYKEKGSEIFTELSDLEDQVIMGIVTIEEFKKTLEELKEYGLNDIAKEVQANYESLVK